MRREEVLCLFPEGSRDRWREVAKRAEGLQEIRFRVGMPVLVGPAGKSEAAGSRRSGGVIAASVPVFCLCVCR